MLLVASLIGFVFLPVLKSNTLPGAADTPQGSKIFMPVVMKMLPDFFIMRRSTFMALPTSGPAWNALKAAADSDPGFPDLCNQDNRTHPKVTLASALVYARTGIQAYADRARYLILTAYPTQIDGCSNAVLALGRQLGAYVISANLIGLQDGGFNIWLYYVRDKYIGGHNRWYALRQTAYDTAGNWGIFALASTIAADRFLGDSAALASDWQVFADYGVPHGWPFNKTPSYSEDWACVSTDGTGKLPIAINTPCTKSGYDLDGAPVEDSSRTTFPTVDFYPTESAQGLVVQALLLDMAGYPAWTVNNSQIMRLELFRGRFNNLNLSSTDYYVTWITNKVYGLNQPTQPASFGRLFGFTDWLFGP